MIISAVSKKQFSPINLSITIESEGELAYFLGLSNSSLAQVDNNLVGLECKILIDKMNKDARAVRQAQNDFYNTLFNIAKAQGHI